MHLSDQIGIVLFQDQNQYNKFAAKEISTLYADREQQYILEFRTCFQIMPPTRCYQNVLNHL